MGRPRGPKHPGTRNDSKEKELFLAPGRLPQREEVTDSGHRLTGAPGLVASSSEEASPPIWAGTLGGGGGGGGGYAAPGSGP